MNKRYVIFDMDGTLLDSMQIWKNLGREYLNSKGITQSAKSFLEEIEALTLSESAALLAERFPACGTAEAAMAEMNQRMEEHYRKDIPLKKGMPEMLESFRRSGVRMCVASATGEHLMRECLERLGVLNYFEFLLSCETLKTNKREAGIYLEAVRRFGTSVAETAVYEDALYAIETAKNAGFYVVAVYDSESEQCWEKICNLADEILDGREKNNENCIIDCRE